MSRLPAFLGTVFVCLAACSNYAEPSGQIHVTERDSAGVRVLTISGAVTDLPVVRFDGDPAAEVSGDAPPYLGRIGEVEFLSDASLLVEDAQSSELHLFDAAGNVLGLMGGAGEGPGEFRNLTALTVTPGDTIYAYDRGLSRVSAFDRHGALIRTIGVAREDGGLGTLARDVWAFDSDHLLLHRMSPWDSATSEPRPRRDQRDVILFSLDRAGRVRPGPIRFTGGYTIEGDDFDGPAPFANQPIIVVGGGRVVHGSGLAYELTVRGADLRPSSIVRWHGWQEPVVPAAIEAARDSFEASFGELLTQRPDVVDPLVDAIFSPELLPDLMPGIGSAFVDSGGRMWISRFTPTMERWNEQEAWHVLDRAGHPQFRVRLPERSRLAAVKQDRIALIMRDDLDVDHLGVFMLPARGSR